MKEEEKKSHLKLWKEKVLLASHITLRRGRAGLCAVTAFLLQIQQQWTPTESSARTCAIALALPRSDELSSSVPARASSRMQRFLLPMNEGLHL